MDFKAIFSDIEFWISTHITELYTALAWGGLKGTSAWETLDEATKNKYNTYLNRYDELEVSSNRCS